MPGLATTPPSCRRWPFSSTHRHVQPAVVGPEAGGPHDRSDPAVAQIELQRRRIRHARRLEPLRRRRRRRRARSAAAHSSNVSSSRSILRSASANRLRSPPEKSARPSRTAGKPADDLHAHRAERVEIERRALGRAHQLRRRQPARARQIVDLVVALVPHARAVHPPQHVAAAIGARQPHVLADRQRDGPPGLVDLRGELQAGGRWADDEHAAFGQLAGVAVVERRELRDRRPAPRRARTARWARLQAPLAMTTQRQREARRGWWRRDSPSSVARDGRHRRVVRTGACETRGEARDELDHLAGGHVAVGIGAVVVMPGQAALPVGREQAQRVPALAPPRVGDLAALEHDVIDRSVGEEAAERRGRHGRPR